MSKNVRVEAAKDQFEIGEAINLDDPNKGIKLDEVKDFVSFQRVSCEVKVVSVEKVKEVSGGKRMKRPLCRMM